MDSLTSRVGAWALSTRSVARAPIWLYRHRLGRLMGDRVLMLEHRGRTSGLPRYVCLEVVARPSATTIVVASGFGEGSQWYRNLSADPTCRVSLGRQVEVPAHARLLDEEESRAVLAGYQAAHPTAWRRLRAAIERVTGEPVTSLPMVELTLSPAAEG
ncbi:nitroreductase family deazaflavin-dependent oxidoreductase [Nocardioides sp. YIM 152588]|uniref:nitroreductase family deazaflavin-dependent oxidoreductase n=1 Tax=Nocardioides sp. YIM 152588 TaxID=3158259 RepID=UPI0032E492F2